MLRKATITNFELRFCSHYNIIHMFSDINAEVKALLLWGAIVGFWGLSLQAPLIASMIPSENLVLVKVSIDLMIIVNA